VSADLDALARRLVLPHARRLVGRDGEDATQEILLLVARGIHGYRWEASFTSWTYRIASRHLARVRARAREDPERLVEDLDAALLVDHEPPGDAALGLLAQEANLACAYGVLVGLSPAVRHAYLLADLLRAPDVVGASLLGTTPAAYRARASRGRAVARRAVREPGLAEAASELDALADLGALYRAHRSTASPEGLWRAARATSPRLLAA